MIKTRYFIAMSLSLASCTNLSASEIISSEPVLLFNTQESITNEPKKPDKRIICYEPSEYDIKPELPDTGVRRETPIDVISKKLFIERLKVSPLWDETERKQEDRYSFRLVNINGFFQIQGDGSFSKSEKITRIAYSPLNVKQRNKYGHQLLEQEKFGMTETINIVINDYDKANEILDQLYQQYLVKAENNDVLNDEETLHSYIRYDGKLFELWGLSRNTHPLEACNFNMLTTLTIS